MREFPEPYLVQFAAEVRADPDDLYWLREMAAGAPVQSGKPFRGLFAAETGWVSQFAVRCRRLLGAACPLPAIVEAEPAPALAPVGLPAAS